MTTWLANRYSNLSTFNAVAINYSTLTGTTITVTSTMVSLGASTNQTYTALSKGNFTSTSNWVTSLTGRTSTIGVSMSANALTQLVVSQSSSTTSIQYTSTLGASWSTLSNASGLPSSLTTSYSAGAISGDGKYGVLGTTTGQLFVTANAGASWTNSGTIWTNTIPYAPVVYLPFENSLNDVSGNGKNGVATGTITYVPGIVGKNAVYIQNTPGAAVPTSYIRGVANSWTVPTRFTISFWFNAPILNGTLQMLFCALTLGIQIYIQSNNTVVIAIPSGTSTNYVNISSSSVISANTWYYVTLLYQANGTSSFYLNNQLMGTATSTGLGTHPQSNIYSLGSYDAAVSGGFNGYIDDLKIYNNMVTYSAPVLANFSNVAISNSGQYMLASATGAGLYLSSDYGSTTFSPVTGAMLSALWTAAQVSASGQYMLANSPVVMVQPQLTGLNANTWYTNGITWTASISSVYSTNSPNYYLIFNNVNGGTNGYPTNTVYSAANPGLYTGSISTSIVGQAALLGEYFQVQSSVPLQMYSYRLNAAGYWQFPNTYTIAGSNDGSTWYLLQSVTMNQNPCGTTVAGNYAISSNNIIINQSGTQTMTTSISSAILTCTASAYSANAYTYFRLIVPTIWNNQTPYVATQAALGQWIINFQAGGQTYSTNYGSSWNNGYALYSGQTQMAVYNGGSTISPQLTGLASATAIATWQANGVTWIGSASSNNGANVYPFRVFNNTNGDAWLSDNVTQRYNPDGTINGNASSTVVSGVGTIRGEYVQLQSSVPLVMYSFALGRGLNPEAGNAPKTYYIIGSNDGTTWYTLQIGTTNIGSLSGSTNYIIINQSGVQTLSGASSGNITTAAATYATNAYTYFRLVGTSIINGGGSTYMEIGEWYINFTPPSSIPVTIISPSTTLSLSESGQTALSTTISNPVLLAELNFEGSYIDVVGGLTNPSATGTGITFSSTAKVGSNSLSIANTAGQSGSNSYVSYTLPAFFAALPNAFTISAWINPSSLPGTNTSAGPIQMGFVGSGGGKTLLQMVLNPAGIFSFEFFTTTNIGTQIQIMSVSAITLSVWTHITGVVANGIAYLYINGILQNSASYTGVPCIQTNGLAATTLVVGCVAGNYNQYAGLIDDLRIYNSALPPQQIQTIYANNVSSTTLTQLVPSFSVSPQQTGLASNTWSQGGVAWTSSVSSALNSNYPAWAVFNNSVPNSATGIYSWASMPSYALAGTYNGSFTTPITGISPNPMPGEWLQIQSSVPLVMYSYNFAAGGISNIPKNYYIVGSDNGITWNPIQSVTMGATNPFITNFSNAASPNIIVNQSGTQTMNGGNSATLTCTTYATTTTAYTYFRIISNTVFGAVSGNVYFELEEWFLTFTGPPNTSLYNVVSPLTNFSTGSSVSTGTIPGVITGSAVSTTGQYMVVVTNNTSGNNVYYSTNTGATFTGLQLGSSPMTSAAISYDGSYITVSNATTVYTLNNNNTGYSVAIGNQAGQQNQAVNAIAIGNYAGYQNQTANSIILNATGSTVNSVAQGFYVAPIAQYTASSSQTFSLLGHGSDNQVVQTATITMSTAGNIGFTANVGIGTTSPAATLDIVSPSNLFDGTAQLRVFNNSPTFGRAQITIIGRYENGNDGWDLTSGRTTLVFGYNTRQGGGISYVNAIQSFNGSLGLFSSGYSMLSPAMMIAANGNVGINTTSPTSALHVNGAVTTNMGTLSGSTSYNIPFPDSNRTYLFSAKCVGVSNTGGIIAIAFWGSVSNGVSLISAAGNCDFTVGFTYTNYGFVILGVNNTSTVTYSFLQLN